MYEGSIQELLKESWRRVHEANQAKLESDSRLRNAEFEALRKSAMSKNAENDAIARPRTESLQQSNTERRMEYYESPCENEKMSSTELRAQIAEKDGRMKAILDKGSSVICGSSDRLFIERLENQMKTAEIRAQDMNVEIGEIN